ncbi:MAG: TlpA disulfide reductase family protein [Crocinitomicaceae bacterium]
MKKLGITLSIIVFSMQLRAQETLIEKRDKTLPDMTVVDMDGNTINPSKVTNDGKPMIVNFWATWCAPCKRELSAIDDVYQDWVDETGVKLIAVSIDDERTKSRVKPFVDGEGWEYDIWMDPNWDFKRAMGVNNAPFTFLLDGNGKIVYEHNNYSPGDENILHAKLLELVNEAKKAELKK